MNNWLMTLVRKSLGEGRDCAVSSYRWSICWGICPAARIRANISPCPLSRLAKTIAPPSLSFSSSSGEAVALLSPAQGFIHTRHRCRLLLHLCGFIHIGRRALGSGWHGPSRDTHTKLSITSVCSLSQTKKAVKQQRFDFKVQGHQQKVSRLSSGSNKTFQGCCQITT